MCRKLSITALFFGLFLLVGCQTSLHREFSKVKVGMDKHAVIELMGSPRQAQRFHGKDRWFYVYYNENSRVRKEVHFEDGLAVYVGDVWEPPAEKSAAIIDSKNDESNVKAEADSVANVEQNRKAYEQYKKEVKGEDKVRYLPEFEVIR